MSAGDCDRCRGRLPYVLIGRTGRVARISKPICCAAWWRERRYHDHSIEGATAWEYLQIGRGVLGQYYCAGHDEQPQAQNGSAVKAPLERLGLFLVCTIPIMQ